MNYTISKTRLEKEVRKQKEKEKEINKAGKHTLFPKLAKQFEELGMDIRREEYRAVYDKLTDDRYDQIRKLEQAGQPVIKKVSMMQRKKNVVDYKTHKRFEALTWHELWVIPNGPSLEFECGIDYQVSMKQEFESDGTKTHKPVNKVQIYTQPFSKEKVQELLQKYPDTDLAAVQYTIVDTNNKAYSVNEEEFKELSHDELTLRGRSGFAIGSYPIDFELSKLSPDERLQRGIK